MFQLVSFPSFWNKSIGLFIFLGIEVADDKEDSVWLANKIVNLCFIIKVF